MLDLVGNPEDRFFHDEAHFPSRLLTTKCDCGLLNKVGPAEFDIPKNVLDLVYAQILCW